MEKKYQLFERKDHYYVCFKNSDDNFEVTKELFAVLYLYDKGIDIKEIYEFVSYVYDEIYINEIKTIFQEWSLN